MTLCTEGNCTSHWFAGLSKAVHVILCRRLEIAPCAGCGVVDEPTLVRLGNEMEQRKTEVRTAITA
jgi:hypothetical protein